MQTIKETAREIAYDASLFDEVPQPGEYEFDRLLNPERLTARIADALERERERCIQVVRDIANEMDDTRCVDIVIRALTKLPSS